MSNIMRDINNIYKQIILKDTWKKALSLLPFRGEGHHSAGPLDLDKNDVPNALAILIALLGAGIVGIILWLIEHNL
jgi:hypothetical protein